MALADFRDDQDRIQLHHCSAGVASAQEVADLCFPAVEEAVERGGDIHIGQLFAGGAQLGAGRIADSFGCGDLVGRAVAAPVQLDRRLIVELPGAEIRFGLQNRRRAGVDIEPAQHVAGRNRHAFLYGGLGDAAAGFGARDDLPECLGPSAQGQAGRAHPGLDRAHHNFEAVAGVGLFGVMGGGIAIEQRAHREQEDHGDKNGEGGDIGTVHVTTGLPASDRQACLRRTVFTFPSR
jgi:hypothetical protein